MCWLLWYHSHILKNYFFHFLFPFAKPLNKLFYSMSNSFPPSLYSTYPSLNHHHQIPLFDPNSLTVNKMISTNFLSYLTSQKWQSWLLSLSWDTSFTWFPGHTVSWFSSFTISSTGASSSPSPLNLDVFQNSFFDLLSSSYALFLGHFK